MGECKREGGSEDVTEMEVLIVVEVYLSLIPPKRRPMLDASTGEDPVQRV